MMGSPKCRTVGKSQSVLILTNPIISTRTRHSTFSPRFTYVTLWRRRGAPVEVVSPPMLAASPELKPAPLALDGGGEAAQAAAGGGETLLSHEHERLRFPYRSIDLPVGSMMVWLAQATAGSGG
jgi:hypothetical protein